MAHRTFTIELKVDLNNDDERYPPMKKLVAIAARDLMAQTAMLMGDKTPNIIMFTEDNFYNTEDIELSLAEDDSIPSGPAPAVTDEELS